MELPTSPPSTAPTSVPVTPPAPEVAPPAAANHAPTASAVAPTTLEGLCGWLVEQEGSDLHLRAGAPPMVRVHGVLQRLGESPWDRETVDAMVMETLTRSGRALDPTGPMPFERDAGLTLPGIGRFRVHAYRERGSWAEVLRFIPEDIPPWDSLRLPRSMRDWAAVKDGIIVVSGPTGSGKSTTLAALVDLVNATRPCHILIVEDPLEFVHHDRQASISQREVPTDTPDFASALRAGMREDPDVIVVGEVRDAETLRTSLRAAETGHLVLVSVHARSVGDTIHRMLDLVPEAEQRQVRNVLADTIRGVVSQRLVAAKSGGGRRLVCEVAQATGRLREVIRDPDSETTISDVLAEGEFHGMQTMQAHAVTLALAGDIYVSDAEGVVPSASDLHVALRKAGMTQEQLSSSRAQ